MTIWIRSQDKTSLIECKKIDICESRDKYEFIANYKYYDGDETYDDLGEYSTKEKAIKVLDMIQEHIVKHSNNVFEMPKDIIIINDKEVE